MSSSSSPCSFSSSFSSSSSSSSSSSTSSSSSSSSSSSFSSSSSSSSWRASLLHRRLSLLSVLDDVLDGVRDVARTAQEYEENVPFPFSRCHYYNCDLSDDAFTVRHATSGFSDAWILADANFSLNDDRKNCNNNNNSNSNSNSNNNNSNSTSSSDNTSIGDSSSTIDVNSSCHGDSHNSARGGGSTDSSSPSALHLTRVPECGIDWQVRIDSVSAEKEWLFIGVYDSGAQNQNQNQNQNQEQNQNQKQNQKQKNVIDKTQDELLRRQKVQLKREQARREARASAEGDKNEDERKKADEQQEKREQLLQEQEQEQHPQHPQHSQLQQHEASLSYHLPFPPNAYNDVGVYGLSASSYNRIVCHRGKFVHAPRTQIPVCNVRRGDVVCVRLQRGVWRVPDAMQAMRKHEEAVWKVKQKKSEKQKQKQQKQEEDEREEKGKEAVKGESGVPEIAMLMPMTWDSQESVVDESLVATLTVTVRRADGREMLRSALLVPANSDNVYTPIFCFCGQDMEFTILHDER